LEIYFLKRKKNQLYVENIVPKEGQINHTFPFVFISLGAQPDNETSKCKKSNYVAFQGIRTQALRVGKTAWKRTATNVQDRD